LYLNKPRTIVDATVIQRSAQDPCGGTVSARDHEADPHLPDCFGEAGQTLHILEEEDRKSFLLFLGGSPFAYFLRDNPAARAAMRSASLTEEEIRHFLPGFVMPE